MRYSIIPPPSTPVRDLSFISHLHHLVADARLEILRDDRTTYTAQSDAAFPAIVDLVTAYLKDGFYKQYQSLHHVKLVEAWQDQGRDWLFPGWMKCSLQSLWYIWRNMQDRDYMRKSYMMVREKRDV